MKCNNQIAILMATYNGAAYVSEQIDSILGQLFTDWHLYIHDDGSSDETVTILNRYAQDYPRQLTLLHHPAQGGACRNFLSMLEAVDAPYYMFSDQDDQWLPEKVAKTWARMKELEQSYPEIPVIVHSDLTVVDARLQHLAPSFIRDQHIKIDRIKTFADYAATNTVTGCTMLLNKAARQCMKRPYDQALMHDAWICLSVAACEGIVEFIDEPLTLYRQHGKNTLGARDIGKMTVFYKLRQLRHLLKADVQHYREMNAVKPLSVVAFIKAKMRYRKD